MTGFTDGQIIKFRQGKASFDIKLNALAQLSRETTLKRGNPSSETIQGFFNAGYDEAGLIDVLISIGDKTISNFLHGITQIPVDFP